MTVAWLLGGSSRSQGHLISVLAVHQREEGPEPHALGV